MSFKIKNWKLAGLALIIFCTFISLGKWQYSRGIEKQHLLDSYHARMQAAPITSLTTGDLRFFKAKLTGHFDNQRTFLLDNKTLHGQIGYEVYTPFKIDGKNTSVLVDRGFIQMTGNRKDIPKINEIDKKVTITGLLNQSPTYVALGEIKESHIIHWPLRIEYVDLPQLAELTGYSLFPYVLQLEPTDPAAYKIEWQIVMMSPEKHYSYAVQWFAFAATLLILFAVLNKK